MSYADFFAAAFDGDRKPHPYQQRLAEQAWPDFLMAPTGLGKTAAVTLAWAYKRFSGDADTPRRLVWCLPMRTLVEQTADEARRWMENLKSKWTTIGREPPPVFTLLGGAVDEEWVRKPASEAIIIGTQDMLLSRALNRGYGMNRFRWPIDFSLLHTDCLWVFDEVQLMGAGLATSAQLEAFRRRDGRFIGARSKSLWVSATLDPDWLATVDFRRQVPQPVVRHWNDGDAAEPPTMTNILDAKKSVSMLDGVKAGKDEGKQFAAYVERLAAEVRAKHVKEQPTLVILNRVRRAQSLFDALSKDKPPLKLVLLHSRFRPEERAKIVERVRAIKPGDDVIIISTQAVEAGVDISSCVLITDLAPWSSMVQRFGRCNRRGEYGTKQGEGAAIYWIDAEDDDKAALPYALDELKAAREQLKNLTDAAPRGLAPAGRGPEARQVIRRKDFEELFDTDADLMGYDVDIAPFVRDAEDTDVRLFWRELPANKDKAGLEGALRQKNAPERNELCAAPIGAVNDWLKAKEKKDRVFRLDILATGEKRRWNSLSAPGARWVKPGDVLMVASDLGAYTVKRGFDPASKAPVPPVRTSVASEVKPDSQDDDLDSIKQKAVGLEEHLVHVRDVAKKLCAEVSLPAELTQPVVRAAAWHDVGKAHEQFQLRAARSDGDPSPPLAKATNWRRTWKAQAGPPPVPDYRPYFRHELASALAFLAHHDGEDDADLVAYLIAAHHGKVRMGIRSLADEKAPPGRDRLFARGVWDGDALPAVKAGDETSAATILSLDLMRMGESASGRASWSARTLGLLAQHGPFVLSYLETLVRLADWEASEDEQK